MMYAPLAPLGEVAGPFHTSYTLNPQPSHLIFFKLMFTDIMDWVAFFPNYILFAASYFNTGTSSGFFMNI